MERGRERERELNSEATVFDCCFKKVKKQQQSDGRKLVHFHIFSTWIVLTSILNHFAQFARDHPFFQSSIHFPNRTWVDPVFAIKTPSVKRSGPACFGTVRFWVRKISILLRLTHVWTSLYLEKFIWSSRIGSK